MSKLKGMKKSQVYAIIIVNTLIQINLASETLLLM